MNVLAHASIDHRATKFLQARFPIAPLLTHQRNFFHPHFPEITLKKAYTIVAFDPSNAVKQALVAIPNLGTLNEVRQIAREFPEWITDVSKGLTIGAGLKDVYELTDSNDMVQSPRLILYTDTLHCSKAEVFAEFKAARRLVELINESEMRSSVFISYGGPDEVAAKTINGFLQNHRVKTWFFPDDALPGQKLHRVMSDGVANYDRVLLVCSKSSLNRPGVLNELERVLEREAKEGGTEILIPVTIDKFVFDEWAPERADIARQVRARVITMFATDPTDPAFSESGEKLLKALTRH